MTWMLCLMLLAPQEFYEMYESGTAKLEARDYAGAIKDLEAATAARPRSSETARKYGVQLFAYLPYHRLAEAYLMTKNYAKASECLERAYENDEHKAKDDTVAAKMDLIQGMLLNFDTPQDQLVEAPGPDIGPIIDLATRQERYEEALDYIELMLASYPDDTALLTLKTITEALVNTLEKVDRNQQRQQRRISDLARQARESEDGQDWEQALRLYITLDKLDPGNPATRRAIVRIEQELENIGRSQEDIQFQYEEARKALDELEKQYAAETAEREAEAIKLRQEVAQLKTSMARLPRTSPKIGNVDIQWSIIPVSNEKKTAHINADITANVALREAALFVNGEKVRSWSIKGRWRFKLPSFLDFGFRDTQNKLELEVRDVRDQTYRDSFMMTFPKSPPFFGKRMQQILAIAMAAVVLVAFALHKMHQRKAFRERFNPYIAGAPVLNEQMFYGREGLLRQILNTLHNNSLMIYGERRIGKTSFLHRLNNALPLIDDPDYEFIPALVDLQGVREGEFFATLEHEIAAALEPRGIALEPPPSPLEARKFISRLRLYINALKDQCQKKPKLVLLLDEVDVMNGFAEQTNQQLRSVFMKGFAEHIVAVMAGINIKKQWTSEGSPWYNFFEQIELKPFPRNHADALITQPVRGVYHYAGEAVELIMDLTGGKPYLIQKICLNLISHILSENRRKITTDDVKYVYREIKPELEGAQS